MSRSFGGRRRATVWGVVLLCLLLVPIPRDSVAAWTVLVRDPMGQGIAGIVVDQSWYDYTCGLQGQRSDRTDAHGRLTFPRVRTYRPVVVFMGMVTVHAVFNFHRVPGRAAVVLGNSAGITFEPSPAGNSDCRDRSCVGRPLSVVLTARPTIDR